MIENVSTQLTLFHCFCPLPASRKGLRLPLRSALFGEGGRDWRPCCANLIETTSPMLHTKSQGHWPFVPENKIFKGFLPYMGVVALTFETYL